MYFQCGVPVVGLIQFQPIQFQYHGHPMTNSLTQAATHGNVVMFGGGPQDG